MAPVQTARVQPVFVVDAFADGPFTGNPAAVCILPAARDTRWMQLVAREMNLSETAFVSREDAAYRLRWFTPTLEVDLCGHATLASAHVLWESGHVPATDVCTFETRSGTLTARRENARIVLDFPSLPPALCEPPDDLRNGIGQSFTYVGRNTFDFLVEVDSESTVRNLRPDLAALGRLPARGVMVTSRSSDPAVDFVSRFFAPAAGIPEDPVTGSAHCCLGPYWEERLGKPDLVGRQLSARGGTVHVAMRGARAHLGGQSITMMRGEILHA